MSTWTGERSNIEIGSGFDRMRRSTAKERVLPNQRYTCDGAERER
jgi:hypothetical protein